MPDPDLIPDPVNPGPNPVVVGSMTPTATISGTPTVGALAAFASGTGLTSAAASTEVINVTAGGVFTLSPTASVHYLSSAAQAPITVSWTAVSPQLGDRVIVTQGYPPVVSVANDPSGAKVYNCATSAPTPLSANGSAEWMWNGVGWVMQRHEQGAWITAPFSAAAFVATSPLTWTVAAGNITRCAYRLRGQEITLSMYLMNTILGGSAANYVAVRNPMYGGFTAVGYDTAPVSYLLDTGVAMTAPPLIYSDASTPDRVFIEALSRPFAVGGCHVYGQLTFEVT
jgi:hypothetical protein